MRGSGGLTPPPPDPGRYLAVSQPFSTGSQPFYEQSVNLFSVVSQPFLPVSQPFS